MWWDVVTYVMGCGYLCGRMWLLMWWDVVTCVVGCGYLCNGMWLLVWWDVVTCVVGCGYLCGYLCGGMWLLVWWDGLWAEHFGCVVVLSMLVVITGLHMCRTFWSLVTGNDILHVIG